MSRKDPPRRSDYKYFEEISSRWMDNDIYGHVNNVTYYSFFDTAIAQYLMQEGGLNPWRAEIIGLAVETGCSFHSSVAFPDKIHAGLRVGHLGNSSVRYEIGIFRNDSEQAAADGHFVHVFVDRKTQKPILIPDGIRRSLQKICH